MSGLIGWVLSSDWLTVFLEKLDEMLAGTSQDVVMRPRPTEEVRSATVRQRPSSRRITQAEINVRTAAVLLGHL